MMLWYLLKKDILIIKKYVLIMLAAAVLIPPFMLWRVPEYAGILGFMLSVIFCVLILLQYISLKEYQFPKAASLLCAATFSRKMMVLSLYIFCIAVYVVCCTTICGKQKQRDYTYFDYTVFGFLISGKER